VTIVGINRYTQKFMMTINQSEWIYSSSISSKLLPINSYIHDISSVPWLVEFFIASCGYAHNPVMFPLWPIIIYTLTKRGLMNTSIMNSIHTPNKFQMDLLELDHGSVINTLVYISTVIITLLFTEVSKASFATTRPSIPSQEQQQWKRRYGKLIASLKSKHSFPSGDCAQAMNVCMFLYRYVPLGRIHGNALPITLFLFGVYLLGVAFARVFYRCHWIEDCTGGILLSYILHLTLIPTIANKIIQLSPLLFDKVKWI